MGTGSNAQALGGLCVFDCAVRPMSWALRQAAKVVPTHATRECQLAAGNPSFAGQAMMSTFANLCLASHLQVVSTHGTTSVAGIASFCFFLCGVSLRIHVSGAAASWWGQGSCQRCIRSQQRWDVCCAVKVANSNFLRWLDCTHTVF